MKWYHTDASKSIISRYDDTSLHEAGAHDTQPRVDEIAKKKGVSMAQIAISWTLSKEGVSAPIVGSTSIKNLEDILGMSVSLERRAPDTHTRCTRRTGCLAE